MTGPEEVCDDGNILDGDGCRGDCRSNEQCGNTHEDSAAGEQCDDGNLVDGDGCSSACRNEVCGNGVRNPLELCDDGNMVSEDGCSADCMSNEACGNNVIDMHLGEQCEFDDSPFPRRFGDTADCDNDCTLPMCGDGHTNVLFEVTIAGSKHFEQCDGGRMGMRLDSRNCDSDCTFVECGDQHINEAAGEGCDSGAPIDKPSCDSDCTLPRCGDGHTNPFFDPVGGPVQVELCDTAGNTASCDSDCTPPRCGDGHVNPAAGEDCEQDSDCGDPSTVNCSGCRCSQR